MNTWKEITKKRGNQRLIANNLFFSFVCPGQVKHMLMLTASVLFRIFLFSFLFFHTHVCPFYKTSAIAINYSCVSDSLCCSFSVSTLGVRCCQFVTSSHVPLSLLQILRLEGAKYKRRKKGKTYT